MTSLELPAAPGPRINRNVLIAGGVVVLHVLVIWALQTGLLRRAVEVIVPAEILSELITPPAPKVEVPPEPPPTVKQPVVKKTVALPPPPLPIAIADPTPAPNAPTGVTTPQPLAPPIAAPVAVAAPPAAPAATAGPPKVELPSSDASYLSNPSPAYPPMSKRLGEQGKVMLRVLIGPDGLPQKAEITRSSGFDRLDRAAIDYVMKCRYVPGKVGGVPQAMWYTAPVNYELTN